MSELQRVIGDEAKEQLLRQSGSLPDAVVACVGGGSNAIGMFRAFVPEAVALYGVEAAGEGIASGKHAATLTAGTVGVLHGARTMVLSDADGQILEAHSVSAGLDYPGVGPEHAFLQQTGRATYLTATDDEALPAAELVARTEGIIIALETAHAFARVGDVGRAQRRIQDVPARIAVCFVRAWRQGPRDVGKLEGSAPVTVQNIERTFASLKAEKKTALVAYLCVGDPSVADSTACALAAVEAGADMLEIGVPFSDPTADGPVIAAAAFRAIQNGGSLTAALDVVRAVRAKSNAPMVLFTYYNPILAFGESRLPAVARDAGVDALLVVDLPPEEGEHLRSAAKDARLAFIPLVAPTSGPDRERGGVRDGERVRLLRFAHRSHRSRGRLDGRCPSMRANALRDRAGLPVVVGFGIDSGDKARVARRHGVSGVVVGTAIVKAIASGKDTAGKSRQCFQSGPRPPARAGRHCGLTRRARRELASRSNFVVRSPFERVNYRSAVAAVSAARNESESMRLAPLLGG